MSLKDWNILLSQLSDLSDWLPLLVFLTLPSKGRKKYAVLGVYLLINSVLKMITLILAARSLHTIIVYHFLSVIEISTLFIFYSKILDLKKILSSVCLILILTINFSNTIFFQGIQYFNSNAWAFNTIILLVLNVLYFYELISKVENIILSRTSLFIINAGLLIYFSGSFFTYILAIDILSQEAKGFFHNAWIIRSVADIVKCPILCYGLWMEKHN